MRDALIAHSRGECDTPMPMHLDIAPDRAEVHIKSSYRRAAAISRSRSPARFPATLARGLSTGNGMMLLSSAETGEPVAFLADAGHLTDVRTAAVAAMAARELGRADTRPRHPGHRRAGAPAGPDACRSAASADGSVIWGRTPERAAECRRDLQALLPRVEVADRRFAGRGRAPSRRLIVTATASRAAAAVRRRHAARHAHLRRGRGFARQAGTRPRDPPPRRAAAGGFAPPV